MSSIRFFWASVVALLGLFINSTLAQDRIAYRGNGGQILVPVGRPVKPVVQPIPVERNTVPPKVYSVPNALDVEIPRPYEFGFQMNDGNGTTQHRQETRKENGDVQGSYGYVDGFGIYRKVEYYTDANGYHAKVTSNEPGLSNKNSANTIFVIENPPLSAAQSEQRPLVLIPRREVA